MVISNYLTERMRFCFKNLSYSNGKRRTHERDHFGTYSLNDVEMRRDDKLTESIFQCEGRENFVNVLNGQNDLLPLQMN